MTAPPLRLGGLVLSLIAVLAPLAAGCGGSVTARERRDVIPRILPSAVQLRSERVGGARRAASGVVLAADPESKRSWILTTRHFLDPGGAQDVYVVSPSRKGRVKAVVSAMSPDLDLAVIEVAGLALPPVTLQEIVRLGDVVWVAAFPWGRQLTVVSGVVSQLSTEEGEAPVEGIIHMVDASVSYGSSGGGVFDAETGALVGIVEGYRTAQITAPGDPDRVLQLPVAGETTVIPSRAILRFLVSSGLAGLVSR
jgi:S1-C subfamily serine protease